LIQRLLRRSDADSRRIVCLSAMFNPEDDHFSDFSGWLKNDDPRPSVHVKWRPTRQLLASLEWVTYSDGNGSAVLRFLEGERPYVPKFIESLPPQPPRKKFSFPNNDKEICIATVNAFCRDKHNVLVYSAQRSMVEPLVQDFCMISDQGYLDGISVPIAPE